jgi:hypothetical protein
MSKVHGRTKKEKSNGYLHRKRQTQTKTRLIFALSVHMCYNRTD